MSKRILAAALLSLSFLGSAAADELSIGYLHCGAGHRTTLRGAVEGVSSVGSLDALVLAGIRPEWASGLEAAFAATGVVNVGAVLGMTGGAPDRMLLLWDRDRLQLRDEDVERGELQIAGMPAPFLARMRAPGAVDFVLAAANFEGSKGRDRALAAIRLSEFAEDESEPIVLLANLDRGVDLDGRNRDGSIGLLTDARIFEWVRPKPLERTDCHLQYQAGLREFLFLAGSAQDWEASVRVAASVEDWCAKHSRNCCWEPPRCRDCGPWHLPIVARFEPVRQVPRLPALAEAPAPSADASEKEQILERIDWLVGELEALRRRVDVLEER